MYSELATGVNMSSAPTSTAPGMLDSWAKDSVSSSSCKSSRKPMIVASGVSSISLMCSFRMSSSWANAAAAVTTGATTLVTADRNACTSSGFSSATCRSEFTIGSFSSCVMPSEANGCADADTNTTPRHRSRNCG